MSIYYKVAGGLNARRLAVALNAPPTAVLDVDIYVLDRDSNIWFACPQSPAVQLLVDKVVYFDVLMLLQTPNESSVVDIAVVPKATPTGPAGDYTFRCGMSY